MKQNKDINIQIGGYSGTGMLPFYALFSSAIFFLAPFIGFGLSTALVYITGIITASIAQLYFTEIVKIDYKTQDAALLAWRQSNYDPAKVPKFEDYVQIMPSRFSQWYTSHTKALIKGKPALSAKKTPSSVRAVA
ncbi:hypothetical protein KBD20_03535 [Candidatus Saccharibacteria bacterium]|nr:hypothetical protein [Candidatus Saccharibacteria bacterium]